MKEVKDGKVIKGNICPFRNRCLVKNDIGCEVYRTPIFHDYECKAIRFFTYKNN